MIFFFVSLLLLGLSLWSFQLPRSTVLGGVCGGVTCCLKQFYYYVLLPWEGSSLVPLLLKDLATEPKAHLVHRKSAYAALRLLLQTFCLNNTAVMGATISCTCTKNLEAFRSVCLSSFFLLNAVWKLQWSMFKFVILRSDQTEIGNIKIHLQIFSKYTRKNKAKYCFHWNRQNATNPNSKHCI